MQPQARARANRHVNGGQRDGGHRGQFSKQTLDVGVEPGMLTRQALDDGVSLVVFPEGGRTLDGHVGPSQLPPDGSRRR